jgi:hypothetical protein
LENKELIVYRHLISEMNSCAKDVRAHCKSVKQAVCRRLVGTFYNILVKLAF